MNIRSLRATWFLIALLTVNGATLGEEHSVFDMSLEELLNLKVSVASRREEIVREAAWWIGYAMAGLVHVLAPDVLLLGGGLVEAMPKLLLEDVGHTLEEHLMPSFVGSYELKVASLGDDATVLGAAAWVRDTVRSGKAKG